MPRSERGETRAGLQGLSLGTLRTASSLVVRSCFSRAGQNSVRDRGRASRGRWRVPSGACGSTAFEPGLGWRRAAQSVHF